MNKWLKDIFRRKQHRLFDLTDYVNVAAKKLWEKDGCKQGRDLDYWLQAEKLVMDQMKSEFPALKFIVSRNQD